MPTSFSQIEKSEKPGFYEFKKYNSEGLLSLNRNTSIQQYMLDIPFGVHDGQSLKKVNLLNNTNYISHSLRNLILTKPIGYVKKQKGKKKK